MTALGYTHRVTHTGLHTRVTHTGLHTRGYTHGVTHTGLHTRGYTHGVTHTGLHTRGYTHGVTHTGLHTRGYTHGVTHTGLHTRGYTHGVTHTGLHTRGYTHYRTNKTTTRDNYLSRWPPTRQLTALGYTHGVTQTTEQTKQRHEITTFPDDLPLASCLHGVHGIGHQFEVVFAEYQHGTPSSLQNGVVERLDPLQPPRPLHWPRLFVHWRKQTNIYIYHSSWNWLLIGHISCRKEMFYLTTHSTYFIFGYMASDIWLKTILIVWKEKRCRHIGYSVYN